MFLNNNLFNDLPNLYYIYLLITKQFKKHENEYQKII